MRYRRLRHRPDRRLRRARCKARAHSVAGFDPDERALAVAAERHAVDEAAPSVEAAVAGAELAVVAAAPRGAARGDGGSGAGRDFELDRLASLLNDGERLGEAPVADELR